MKLTLNPEPDAYGFNYGTARWPNGHTALVNVLPPKSRWQAQCVLGDYRPDATDWVIYVKGEEFGRTKSQDDVVTFLSNHAHRLSRSHH